MNHRHVLILACLATLFVDGLSKNSSAQNAPTRLGPGELNVERSRVYPFVEGKGMGHSHGVEARLRNSRLALGAAQNAGVLVFDMRSFDVDTPRSRQVVGLKGKASGWSRKQVNKEMHGPKILDSNRYPEATFAITSAKQTGVDRASQLPIYTLVGDFKLRNTTRPISFPVTAEVNDGWVRVRGQFTFNQSDYGIKPFSKAFGAMGIADRITVTGDLWIAPGQPSTPQVRQVSATQVR